MSRRRTDPSPDAATLGASRALLAIVASSLAFALYSRAAWPWVVLGWVGLVPFLWVLDRVRSLRAAFAAGLAMAIAFELAVFGWFSLAIADYAGGSPLIPLLFLAVMAPVLQSQFVVAALARTYVRRSGHDGTAMLVLVTASAYVATESFAPKLFGDTLGYPLYGSLWLRQGADIAGVPGLTFVVVAVNACAYAVVRAYAARATIAWPRRALAPAFSAAALLLALAAYGCWRCAALAVPSDATPIRAGLVQANLGHYDRMAEEIGRFGTVRTILDQHFALSAPALAHEDLALLVWPETVYPTTFGKPKSADGAAFDREIVDFVARAGVPLIFGSYDLDATGEFNAAFVLTPASRGEPTGIYRKTRLFPLTERVPAFLDGPWLRQRLPWLGTWLPGSGAAALAVPLRDGSTIHVAPLLCYDVLDPELARASARMGADLIVTLSNDSWFAVGPLARLHLMGAAYRSIETRRPQVRATNTGISAVIDAAGSLVETADVGVRTTLIASVVPERRITTLVMRFGEWLNPCAVAATMLLVAWARLRRPL